MKPIQLELQAFESYADKTMVDFEALTRKGIYLISGDTGSGKTTLFDAICFALYGEASSSFRNDELKTRFVSPDVECYVLFTFEEKGRRYEVRRSPKQIKKKMRGEGTLEQPEQVLLRFLDEPGKTPLSSVKAADEALRNLLGLDVDQFKQVVLLAQGDFSKIITEETSAREPILRNLFHTENYQKLCDRVNSDFIASTKDVTDLSRQLDDVFASTLFEKPVETESIVAPSLQLQTLEENEKEEEEKLSGVEERKKKNDEEKGRLLSASELLAQRDEAAKKLQTALRKKASSDAEGERRAKERKALEEESVLQKDRLEELARLSDKLPDYDRLEEMRRKEEDLSSEQKGAEREKESLASRIQDENQKEEERNRREEEIDVLLQGEEENTAALSLLESKQAPLDLLSSTLMEALRNEGKREQAMKEASHASKEASEENALFLDVQSRYFASIRGELSRELKDNEPCPVCGSLSHPHPASFSPSSVSSDAYRKEQKRKDEKNEEAKEKEQSFSRLDERSQALRKEIEKQAQAVFLPTEKMDLSLLERQVEEAKEKLSSEQAERKRKKEAYRALRKEEEKLREEGKNALLLLRSLKEEQAKNLALLTALAARKEEIGKQGEVLRKSLLYPSREEALKRRERLLAEIQDYDQRKKRNEEERLKQKEENGALQGEIQHLQETVSSYLGPSPEELKEATRKQEQERLALEAESKSLYASLSSLHRSILFFRERIPKLEEARKRNDMLSRLARVFQASLKGSASGLERGVSLENYVLGYYLDRVLAKASTRFYEMTAHRYTLLRHPVSEDVGSGKQGLDIDVVDEVSGTRRKAKTLSGGEIFMASLSLALGLSDCVREERGAYRIEALFIDEGFGTLDTDQALSNVVSVLDDLQSEQDTSIGLITHVPQLAETFPAQLCVSKDREGRSHVKLVGVDE